jgi:hypothetical protein
MPVPAFETLWTRGDYFSDNNALPSDIINEVARNIGAHFAKHGWNDLRGQVKNVAEYVQSAFKLRSLPNIDGAISGLNGTIKVWNKAAGAAIPSKADLLSARYWIKIQKKGHGSSQRFERTVFDSQTRDIMFERGTIVNGQFVPDAFRSHYKLDATIPSRFTQFATFEDFLIDRLRTTW